MSEDLQNTIKLKHHLIETLEKEIDELNITLKSTQDENLYNYNRSIELSKERDRYKAALEKILKTYYVYCANIAEKALAGSDDTATTKNETKGE